MFASFALFIKNCHTVNDDHAVFNLSDLNHCEKTCKTQVHRSNLRRLIVTGCNNNHIEYYRPLTVTKLACENIHFSSLFAAGDVRSDETSPAAKSEETRTFSLAITKWPTNGVIIYRYVSRFLNINFYWPLCPTVHVFCFCVLYRKESANKRYRNNVNNLISPNTVSQNDEKTHTAELNDTAIPRVKIKITEIPHERKPNTAIP